MYLVQLVLAVNRNLKISGRLLYGIVFRQQLYDPAMFSLVVFGRTTAEKCNTIIRPGHVFISKMWCLEGLRLRNCTVNISVERIFNLHLFAFRSVSSSRLSGSVWTTTAFDPAMFSL